MEEQKRFGCALVVDDSVFMQSVIVLSLSPLFKQVVTAGDRSTALRLLKESNPVLVTMDLTLDYVKSLVGVSVMEDIKQCRPDVKIVVISAVDQQWVRDLTLSRGADAYVTKPFNSGELRDTITRLLTPGAGAAERERASDVKPRTSIGV